MSSSPKLNILVAFPYFSDQVIRLLNSKDPESFRLIVDSGAFTAWNTGKNVNFDAYCQFLRSLPKHWEYKAVQLDVYGDPEKTYVNYHRMLDAGFEDIMPVFTRGDTVERLEEFYSHTDYIMFGGIAIGGENTNYVKWFNQVNHERKAHWLGFVNMPFIKHYKPESVDSSSWAGGARFGTLGCYSGAGAIKTKHKLDFANKPKQETISLMTKSGFSMSEIVKLGNKEAWVHSGRWQPEKSDKSLAFFVTACAHVRRSIDVEKNLGTKIYLAASNDYQVETFFDCYDFFKSRGVKL